MNTHTPTQTLLPLEEPAPDDRVFLNGSVWFVDNDGYRVVFRWHEPIYCFALADKVHMRLVAVSLRQTQLATQEEICLAFGHTVSSQARWEGRYRAYGIDGLVSKRPTGRRRQFDKSQEAFVRKWFRAEASNREMAKRLGVDETTIRRTLNRLGLSRKPVPAQPLLPHLADTAPVAAVAEAEPTCEITATQEVEAEAPAEPMIVAATAGKESVLTESFTLDHDPLDRSGDRALARLGLLEDARPLFAEAEVLPRAGVLLAVPLLVRHGLVEAFAKVYGSLGPSFYGLRTMVVTLFLCALLRIKRAEHLKEYRPEDLGRILGLDRAPEVKTVRRKLSRLAAAGRGKALMESLAKQRIAADEDRVAFLYIDGHVREYFGKHRLFQAKKAQRQVAAPAATDTWVHDAQGEPLLVVTSQVNATLTQVLEPILADVRRLVPAGRRITVIFDRGGFSAKLFARLIAAGFDLITYRRGKVRKLPRQRFVKQRRKIDGVWCRYDLCDRSRVRVGKQAKENASVGQGEYLWLREVRVLRDDNRQTPIFTNRHDLSGVEVAYRMFYRWRQENFFKYMGQEFALDALVEYGAEEVAEGTDRRNPRWLQITRQLKVARTEAARLQNELGKEAAANTEAKRPTMRGFKIVHADLRRQLQEADARVQSLLEQRKKIPKRIPANDLETLKTERKLVVDAIKMSAYQVETQLSGMLAEHYARADDEGRTLLHAAFQSPARFEVADGELCVTIAAQSSPHRTTALSALCEQINALAARFPGTNLRLRLAVEAH